MSITFKQDPKNKKVFLQIESAADDFLYAMDRAYWEAGKLMEKYLKKGLNYGKRSGRTYSHYNAFNGSSFKRKSSAPGEFPQRIRGVLKGAVAFTVFQHRGMVFGIRNPSKGFDTEYAEYLEEGTSKMRPRKLVGYTVNKTHQRVKNLLQKRIHAALTKGLK